MRSAATMYIGSDREFAVAGGRLEDLDIIYPVHKQTCATSTNPASPLPWLDLRCLQTLNRTNQRP